MRPIYQRARRGDVMVVHTPLVIDVLGKGRDTADGYRIGIVQGVARDGRASRVDTGRGDIDPRGHQCSTWACPTSWLQAGETVDVPALTDWLADDDNAQPQPTIDAARDVVRRFLRS